MTNVMLVMLTIYGSSNIQSVFLKKNFKKTLCIFKKIALYNTKLKKTLCILLIAAHLFFSGDNTHLYQNTHLYSILESACDW